MVRFYVLVAREFLLQEIFACNFVTELSKTRRADLIKHLQAKDQSASEVRAEATLSIVDENPPTSIALRGLTPAPASVLAKSSSLDQHPEKHHRPLTIPPLSNSLAASSRLKSSTDSTEMPKKKKVFAEQAFLYVKPRANTKEVLALVESCLAAHNIRIADKGRITGREISLREVFDSQYSTLKRFAEDIDPLEIVTTPEMLRVFNSTFDVDWNSIRGNSQLSNAKDACDYLEIDDSELHSMCLHSKWSTVRLCRGVYVSCLDASSTSDPELKGKLQLPIYVINGFCGSMKKAYESPTTVINYMVLEWNPLNLSWADMLVEVVGDRVPSLAKSSSIRGSAHRDWSSLKLHAQPNGKDNCLHVSSSSFEAVAEKYVWLNSKHRPMVLQTDVLASQYLAAQIPNHTLLKWFTNPLINDVRVFDLMYGFGIEQCIEKSSVLTG